MVPVLTDAGCIRYSVVKHYNASRVQAESQVLAAQEERLRHLADSIEGVPCSLGFVLERMTMAGAAAAAIQLKQEQLLSATVRCESARAKAADIANGVQKLTDLLQHAEQAAVQAAQEGSDKALAAAKLNAAQAQSDVTRKQHDADIIQQEVESAQAAVHTCRLALRAAQMQADLQQQQDCLQAQLTSTMLRHTVQLMLADDAQAAAALADADKDATQAEAATLRSSAERLAQQAHCFDRAGQRDRAMSAMLRSVACEHQAAAKEQAAAESATSAHKQKAQAARHMRESQLPAVELALLKQQQNAQQAFHRHQRDANAAVLDDLDNLATEQCTIAALAQAAENLPGPATVLLQEPKQLQAALVQAQMQRAMWHNVVHKQWACVLICYSKFSRTLSQVRVNMPAPAIAGATDSCAEHQQVQDSLHSISEPSNCGSQDDSPCCEHAHELHVVTLDTLRSEASSILGDAGKPRDLQTALLALDRELQLLNAVQQGAVLADSLASAWQRLHEQHASAEQADADMHHSRVRVKVRLKSNELRPKFTISRKCCVWLHSSAFLCMPGYLAAGCPYVLVLCMTPKARVTCSHF